MSSLFLILRPLSDFCKKPMTKPALLFDCDGTITGSEFLPFIVADTIKGIVESLGVEFDQALFDSVFARHKGGGFDKYYLNYIRQCPSINRNALPDLPQFAAMAVENYVNTAEKIMAGEPCEYFSIRHGVVEAIGWAVQNGYRVAVVTNAALPVVEANLKAAGIFIKDGVIADGVDNPIIIDALTCKQDYEPQWQENRKPSAFPYVNACQKLSRDPEGCIVFEDSTNGHKSAFRAGIKTRVHLSDDINPGPEVFEFPQHLDFEGGTYGQIFRPHFVIGKQSFGPETLQEIVTLHNDGSPMFNRIIGQKHGLDHGFPLSLAA